MSFRDTAGKRLKWENTRIPFSDFLFIDQHYGSHPILHRIFSQARKHKYQSVLIEEITESDCALLVEENEALAQRDSDYKGSIVHRFSFFKTPPTEQPQPNDFLGYVILKTDNFGIQRDPKSYVFESVMHPLRLEKDNNFIHCTRTYSVRTEQGDFHVKGVLYAQQNDMTFVCAQVAIRMAAACILPSADISYKRINDLAGIDHKVRKVGNGVGLDSELIEPVLRGLGLGCKTVVNEPGKSPLPYGEEYQREVYGFIESGCPVLLGFEIARDPSSLTLRHRFHLNTLHKWLPKWFESGLDRHLISIIGHTFNDDAWVPEAQRKYFGKNKGYFPSENWLSAYVIHDDNLGPYFCLPRHYLQLENFRILFGIEPTPTSLPLSAVLVEAIAFNHLQAIHQTIPKINEDWYDRFAVYGRCGLLILRTMLVTKTEYLDHLGGLQDWEGHQIESAHIEKLSEKLSEWIWLIEVGAPDLYPTTRRKFGEILFDSKSTADHPAPFAARLPGLFFLWDDGSATPEKTQLTGHTGLF